MLARIPRKIATKLSKTSRCASQSAPLVFAEVGESEYTETPQYPPILDLSPEKKRERKKGAEHEYIKNIRTVEEKQIRLNMPKYYGFKCYMLSEDRIPYNNLRLIQHITRTHLVEQKQNNLPSHYDNLNVDGLLGNLRSSIEEAVSLEYEGYKKAHEITNNSDIDKAEIENIVSKNISNQVNRIILNALAADYPHLVDMQVDFEPRIEATWYAGGMNPPENVKRYRRGQEWQKPYENEPTDRILYYVGTPNLTVRSEVPLQPIISSSEAENPALEVPFFKYDPRTVGTYCDYKRIVNIPGFWPGETHQFGIVSYHCQGHHLERHYDDPKDPEEALKRQGILAAFSWLNAQANFLGFTTFNDITYPLTTQCVITNGKLWSFFVYQLNTMLIHSKHVNENPKRNICWATDSVKLFDEIKDGQVIGFNDDVLKTLVKFYANVPKAPENVNLRPYLGDEEKVIADYDDVDKREWLEREYKFIVSNRPRFLLPYEIYSWEKIYKIDHDTRPMDKRLRPFELKQKPWDRRYDERLPRYIPRKLRPHLPRNKGRYAKEYFP